MSHPAPAKDSPGARHRWVGAAMGAAMAGLAPGWGMAQSDPLSSIGWLSESLAEDSALRPVPRTPTVATRGAGVAPVSVAPLDVDWPDGIGTLAPSVTGFPADLWGPTTTEAVAARLAGIPNDPLPAVRSALEQLLLAELEPPAAGGTPGALLVARIDTLLRLGALDAAADLLDETGTSQPELFRRAFDIALLQGREDEGCATLRASPGVSGSLQARIYCLARSGDWAAAALTLDTAAALGQLSPIEDALLARFLDPALAEGVAPLARLPAPTPLEWRMLEAIGERQPTNGLPRAFAHADLRETAGWKTRIEATEKLVRAGALPADALRMVYGERRPAASGGVWERARAVSALERALETGDPGRVGPALETAWQEMNAAGLGLAFARMVATCLAGVPLQGEAAALFYRMALLTPEYEAIARTAPIEEFAFASALARGMPPNVTPFQGTDLISAPLAEALGMAFSADAPTSPAPVIALTSEGRFGEAILKALTLISAGREADPGDLGGALAFLRRVGLEDTARQAALQILLLEAET